MVKRRGLIMNHVFDVDGTIIDYEGNPRNEIIQLIRTLSDSGDGVFVWSGCGIEYAETICRRVGLLKNYQNPNDVIDGVICKDATVGKENNISIAWDDEDVDLAPLNIKIGQKRFDDEDIPEGEAWDEVAFGQSMAEWMSDNGFNNN